MKAKLGRFSGGYGIRDREKQCCGEQRAVHDRPDSAGCHEIATGVPPVLLAFRTPKGF
jgi:hypothetical protein